MYFLVLETTYWSPERRNFSANLLKLALEETNIWSPVRNFAAMTEAASRTDWLPGSRLAVWPSMQVADLTGVLPQYVIDFVVEHFDDLNLIVLFVANSLLSIVQHSEEKEINMINRLCSPENYS